MKTINIKPDELEIVRKILGCYVSDRDVCAFGSRVIGTSKKFSDLDLVIMGEEPLAISILADLAEAFSESDLVFKVDIIDWATTGESFRKIIEQNLVLVQKGTDI